MGKITLGADIFEKVIIDDIDGNILAEFSFNPADTNIVSRYEDFSNSLKDIGPAIEEYERLNEDKSEYEKAKEMLKTIDGIIYEKFNTFLNADVAKNIFSIMGPLSPTPYGYFFVYIIELIADLINDISGANLKKMDMKIKKHTSKYHR